MGDSQGRPLSIGSGLILRPGLVVTNFHVIEGSGSGVAKRIGDNTKYNVLGVVAKDAFRDLAILQVNGLVTEGAELSQRAMIDIGETVFAVGNPRGLEGTFSAGIVSAHRNINGLAPTARCRSPGALRKILYVINLTVEYRWADGQYAAAPQGSRILSSRPRRIG